MAVTKPVPVPKKNIGSLDVTGFSGGWYLNGEQSAKGNQVVEGDDIELTINGLLQPRKSLQRWLPDTVGTSYQKFPAIWEGEIFLFTADDGHIKWCQEGDDDWTLCGGADNNFDMPTGAKIKFIRVLDVLLIIGGDGGNKLAYVDLATKDVIKYVHVTEPASAPTAAATGVANTPPYKIYYGYTYSSLVGETELSPILEFDISKPRDNWNPDGSEYLTITRPDFGSEPAGAQKWNLYIALASSGGTISPTDMLRLASGLDLNQASIVDNSTLPIDIGLGNPPAANSTDGPRAKHGIETNGRPVLYGVVDENGHETGEIFIGGDGEFALDFSSSNGGFRAEPSKGTNYYPASVVGFRNGQGVPSLTILFSNTEGLSKQATLEQQTVNFGNQSFVVWGVTEQNYGAAGVASPNGVVNYKGQLTFPSVDGMLAMDTAPQLQNVISTKSIDGDIRPYMRRIKVSALNEIVGTAWESRLLYLIPAYGFDTPTQILIRDLNNNGSWNPPLDIPAQWIGTVSPPDSPAFVYISQDNHTYKLFESFGTVDYLGGSSPTFSTGARGALMGINDAHNAYQAVVQAVFYILDLIGDMTIGVTYRDLNGKIKSKSKTIHGPAYTRSFSGGWSDPYYTYNTMPTPPGWDDVAPIDESLTALERLTKRWPLNINDLASEVQWWYTTPDNMLCDYKLKTVSFEGENLGIKPDVR